MEFKPLFYTSLLLCVIVFFEVLVRARKNSLQKICFLLIISSLFMMNYFSCAAIQSKLQFVLVKYMRIIYVCSTMILIVSLVSSKIPKWITSLIIISVFFSVDLRIFNYNEINIGNKAAFSNQVFSVGPEFYYPLPIARYLALGLSIIGAGLTYYYYRRFFMKMNREDVNYKYLCWWMVSMILPFLLLIIFGLLGNFGALQEFLSPYLFSIFSFTIIFSVLFRPKFLNTKPINYYAAK